MSRRIALYVTVFACLTVTAVPALAAKGGSGGGKPGSLVATASCSVEGNIVTGNGLPADQVLNFMVTSASGTNGWVLGFTDTGTWSVTVPARSGPTTYEFASKTWGSNGTKYDVFASCTA